MKTGKVQAILWATLFLGLGLLLLLIERTGAPTILSTVRRLGIFFPVLIFISGARQLLRTGAWYHCIDRDHRQITLADLFNIRLAGEAVTDLTFMGPVLGETVRTMAASKRIPLPHSLSSVVIEDSMYGLSSVLLILSGVFILIFNYPVSRRIRIAGLTVSSALVLVVLAAYFLIRGRQQGLDRVLDRLKKFQMTWGLVERHREKLRVFETNLRRFYTRERRILFSVLFLEILASLTAVFEAYLILSLMTHRTSLLAAYLTEAMNRVVNLIFAFVPLRVGVEEGGAGLALTAVGYNLGAGVSLAIIRKIRNLFWVGMGLLMVARYSLAGALKEDSGPFVRVASECQ